MRVLLAIPLMFLTLAPAAAQKGAQNKEWIAHCVSGISETNQPRARIYCRCMARSVDTSQKLRQTDLERSFPPVHRTCFKKAGFKTPK